MTMFRWLATFILLLLLSGCGSAEPDTTPTAQLTPTASATARIGLDLATRAASSSAQAPVAQITPTPLPSATPTATPTPIIHRVAEGETLWSIAAQNGSDPDSLLALNPGVNATLLSVGDALVLPPRPTPLAQTVRGTDVPLAIQVMSIELFKMPSDAAWVIGEVTNFGTVAAENVQLEIGFWDADGLSLGSRTVWVASPLILPNASAPFGLRLEQFSAEPNNITASVISGKSVSALGNRSTAFTMSDVSLESSDQQVRMRGTVSNTQPITASVSLIASLYDADGRLSGFSQVTIPDQIGGLNSAEFYLQTTVPGRAVTSYKLQAIGLLDQSSNG